MVKFTIIMFLIKSTLGEELVSLFLFCFCCFLSFLKVSIKQKIEK